VSDGGAGKSGSSALAAGLLADYAAGTLNDAFAVLVAAHRQMQEVGSSSARAPADQIGALMPLALRSYVTRQRGPLEAIEWRAFLPGIERCWITHTQGTDAYLLRCRPGSALLRHRHTGREAALVLQGGFHDAGGRYARGDIAVADHTVEHTPTADGAETCVIFVVMEGRVRLTGPFGRLLQRIFRI
jgi:putative transcriptional regulator